MVDLKGNRVTESKVLVPKALISKISNTLWMPDSQNRVMLCYERDGFFLVELDLISRDIKSYPTFGFPTASQGRDAFSCRLLGYIRPGRLLCLPCMSRPFSKKQSVLHLYEISVGVSPNLTEYSLPLKTGEEVLDVALLPDSQRFALLIRSDRLPSYSPLRRFLSRWWPNMNPKPQSVITLCTVRRDGSDRHILGDLPEETEQSMAREHDYRLGWLPGGKKLSFLSQQTLWTLPDE